MISNCLPSREGVDFGVFSEGEGDPEGPSGAVLPLPAAAKQCPEGDLEGGSVEALPSSRHSDEGALEVGERSSVPRGLDDVSRAPSKASDDDAAARAVDDAGAREPSPRPSPDAAPAEAVDPLFSLAVALERASAAGRWDVVAILAKELEARRLEAAGNVVAIGKRAGRKNL